jgi:hypothetical protein
MPTLAVCGGSRCLARGFGATETMLPPEAQDVHNAPGTDKMPHGLTLRPHTILGGVRGGTIDKINSTHMKVANLSSVHKLPATGQPELQMSAKDSEGHPEGFETTYGAPIVGATSHPEAIHGASSKARKAATDQGRAWSDYVMRGFEQSMQTYAARRQVNAQIRDQVADGNIRKEAGRPLRGPTVKLPPHLALHADPDFHQMPPVFFGDLRPSPSRGGTRF